MLGTARLVGQSLGALVVGALYGLWAGKTAQVPSLALAIAAALALAGGATSLLRMREQVRR
jgi:DHA2 family multidrug resistance protein-like MFS transporter